MSFTKILLYDQKQLLDLPSSSVSKLQMDCQSKIRDGSTSRRK